MKLKKLLPVTLALMLGTTAVMAASEANITSSTAEYNLTLADYLKIITEQAPVTSAVSFGTDYSSATIDNALVGQFKVISNNREQILYLVGTCPTADGTAKSLYGADTNCENLKMVLTKTDVPPSGTNVTNITGGTPELKDNTDAIAFALNIATTHKDGATETPLKAEWDSDKVKYTMKNGVATFTCTLQGANVANTFDTHDTDGTYQATLTMTETAI